MASSTKYALLALAPSKTDPSKSYEIRKGADGVTYCTCPSWKHKRQSSGDRTCKHLASFHAGQLGGHSEAVESKTDAAKNLALHAARKAAGDRAYQLDKRVKAGDVAAAQDVIANPKGLSAALQERAAAVLLAQ